MDSGEPDDVIRLAGGVWREKVTIRTPGLRLIGEGSDRSVLVWDDYAAKLDEAGREYNTFRTRTAAVCADAVRMSGLAVVNDALF